MRGEKYDDFVDKFVNLVKKHQPKCLLHLEDFVGGLSFITDGELTSYAGSYQCAEITCSVQVSRDPEWPLLRTIRDDLSVVSVQNGTRRVSLRYRLVQRRYTRDWCCHCMFPLRLIEDILMSTQLAALQAAVAVTKSKVGLNLPFHITDIGVSLKTNVS